MVVHCQIVCDAKNYPLMYTMLYFTRNASRMFGGILKITPDMDIQLVTNQFRNYICQEVNVCFIMYF
jgi:hypothetical protein